MVGDVKLKEIGETRGTFVVTSGLRRRIFCSICGKRCCHQASPAGGNARAQRRALARPLWSEMLERKPHLARKGPHLSRGLDGLGLKQEMRAFQFDQGHLR
jgi:hypothetical protein